MSVSIYYTARRAHPLSNAEQAALDAAKSRYPFGALVAASGVAETDFNGESFGVYPAGAAREPGVVFEGATKLPSRPEAALWPAIQYWCRLLSELRRGLPDALWHVHVDDHTIPWSEELQAFDPTL